MKKTYKKVSIALLIASMTLLAIPTAGLAEEINQKEEQLQTVSAESNQVFVNGIDAIAQKQGEGWSYDDTTRTLILEDASLSQKAVNQAGVIQGEFVDSAPLNLILKGKNTVSVPADSSSIYISGNLKIIGEGTLNVANTDSGNQNSMVKINQGSKDTQAVMDTGKLEYAGNGAITLLSGAKTYDEAQKESVAIECYGDYTQRDGTITLGNDSNWFGSGLVVGQVFKDTASNMKMSGGVLKVAGRTVGISVGNGDMTLEADAQADVLKHDMWNDAASTKWENPKENEGAPKIAETYGVEVFSGSSAPYNNGNLSLSGGSQLLVKMIEESKDFVQNIGVMAFSMSVTEASKINADVEGTFAYGVKTGFVKSSNVDAEPDLLVKDSEISANVSTLHVGDGIGSSFARFDNSKINSEIKGQTYQDNYYFAVSALDCSSNPFNPNMTFKNNLEVLNGSQITAKASYFSDMEQVPTPEKSNNGFIKGIWTGGGILSENSVINAEATLDAQKIMEIPLEIDGVRVVRVTGEDSEKATGHIKANTSAISAKAATNLKTLQNDQEVGGIRADENIELDHSSMKGEGTNWGIASKESIKINTLEKDQIVIGKAAMGGAGFLAALENSENTIDITNNRITLPQEGVIGKTDNSRFNDAVTVLEKQGSKTAATEAQIESGLPARILEDPASITVKPQEKATFSIKSEGSGPMIYKWEVSADGGKTWTMIEGAMGESYTTPAATAEMNGYQYRCSLSNAWDSVTSQAAVLSVSATPAPTPTPNNGGGSNVNTGTADTQTGTACALVLLSIAGLAALGFKRKLK